jgi:hypothetical protein
MTPEERARLLAANKTKGTAAEQRNEATLKYAKNLYYDRQVKMHGTRPDFVLYDKAGKHVIQEVKSGGMQGTKAYNQVRHQMNHARHQGGKYVLLVPGGLEGLKNAKNVDRRIKALVLEGVRDKTIIVKDADKQANFKPLIEQTGGKVATLRGTKWESRMAIDNRAQGPRGAATAAAKGEARGASAGTAKQDARAGLRGETRTDAAMRGTQVKSGPKADKRAGMTLQKSTKPVRAPPKTAEKKPMLGEKLITSKNKVLGPLDSAHRKALALPRPPSHSVATRPAAAPPAAPAARPAPISGGISITAPND